MISNCVINLSVDKPAVLAEMFRVLAPGGRVGISDVVAEDELSPADRAGRGSYVGCIAGALSRARVPRRAGRGRLHRRLGHVHPRGRARHARGHRPGGQAVSRPVVLFVCVHNAGRSQMAAGWLTHLAGDRVDVASAGSEPADRINPVAVAAMAEVGIDITAERPTRLSVDAVRQADVVVTMGCGDACPVFPGKRYEDWDLPDPAGQALDAVRPIRDQIRVRVGDCSPSS